MDLLQSTTQQIFYPHTGSAYGSVIIPDPGGVGVSYGCFAPDGSGTAGGGAVVVGQPNAGLTTVNLTSLEMTFLGTYTVVLYDGGGNVIGQAQLESALGQLATAGTGYFIDSTATETPCTVSLGTAFAIMTIPNTVCINLGPYCAGFKDGLGSVVGVVHGTVVTTFAPSGLDAAGVRAAVGLGAANLDTQLGNIITQIATRAAPGAAMTLTAGERNSVASALLDFADAVETGLTPRQAMRLASAILGGLIVQTAPGVWQFKGAGVATARVTASIPGDGSRPSMILNL